MDVTICIATYRRPAALQRLLEELAKQELGRWADIRLSILVVDNNPEGDAAAVVDALRPHHPLPLRYAHETRRGISQARNRALAETGGSDLIAFIDDDELPVTDWIARLLDLRERTGAEAVMGRIVPEFDGPVPAWALRGGFYEHPQHRDGELLTYAYTGNVLLDRRAVARDGLRFDDALGLAGGEDLCFFAAAREKGWRIAWAEKAVVAEIIPASRIRLGWLLRRWYRTGNTDGLMLLRRRPGLGGRVRGIAGGLARVGAGSVAVAASGVLAAVGRAHVPIGRMYTLSRGLGMISAALGTTFQEYKRTDGGG